MIRTRFAPSPTGSLHVGGARTALYCLLFARANGGRFVLRIEDTDQARSTEAAARGIVRDLAWLGIDWDEGPEKGGPAGSYFQSQRLEIYDAYVETLLRSGHAYEAWESRDELDALRKAAEAEKQTFRYHRRAYAEAELAAFRAEGRVPVVRLEAPRRDLTVYDRILGDVTVVADELEDIVIRKADGFPTYHFAVVVDDRLMEVTQVLRGTEHLMNTPKHLGILEALGWEPPSFGHLPIIMSMAGAKMSKRDKARIAREAAHGWRAGGEPWAALAARAHLDEPDLVDFVEARTDAVATAEAIARALHLELPLIEVMDFRKAGYLPEALLNFLALLGWSPGDDRELLTLDEMIAAFSLERVGRTAARFDAQKLRWMNAEYMKRTPTERLLDLLDQWLEVVESPIAGRDRADRAALLGMYRERCATFAELDVAARFFFAPPAAWEEKSVQKHLLKGGGLERLAASREALAALDDWSGAGVDRAFAALAGEGNLGKYAQPVRIAVSGGPVSPPIHDTLAFLGKDETIARIDACLARHAG